MAVLLELSCIYNEDVHYNNRLPLGDGIDHYGCIFHTLVEPFVEALEYIVRFIGIPEVDIIGYKTC